MNIFNVLTKGNSSLHEPSMSAVFAYLLNPNEDHGLHRKVINGFLELVNKNGIYTNFIDDNTIKFEIDLEVLYQYQGNKYIDIQIKILDSSYLELHRIIIENKIKQSSANTKQLISYYHAVINDKDNDDAFILDKENLSVIFLTPSSNKGLEDEFNHLDIVNKFWVYWNNQEQNNSIVGLIQNILTLEQQAKISPINDYIRHTLKAFAYYVIQTIDSNSGKYRFGEDIGEITNKAEIVINSQKYLIVLRDSGQIQLFNQDGDKIQARPLLRIFLQEKNIKEKPNCQSTRCFGRQIFNYLND